MFSATVASSRNTCCGTYAIVDCQALRFVVSRTIPSASTLPVCGTSSPASTSTSVVLPEPLAPMNPTVAPAGIVSETCEIAAGRSVV